jgi:hypothetical protein
MPSDVGYVELVEPGEHIERLLPPARDHAAAPAVSRRNRQALGDGLMLSPDFTVTRWSRS